MPDLLTVEEAARVLRIGRTKGYAMAREWRATSGRCGLPVVDFGNVLRVPRHALEELIGAPIEVLPALEIEPNTDRTGMTTPPPTPMPTPTLAPAPSRDTSSESPTERSQARRRRAPVRPTNQLDLFSPDAPAS